MIEAGYNIKWENIMAIQSLVSENYLDSGSTNAYNINCSINLHHSSAVPAKITLDINEFSPFATNGEYCMFFGNIQEPIVCSDSKTLHTSYGPFESTLESWNFWITLRDANNIPEVRFWITITSEYFFSIFSCYLMHTNI